MATKVLAMPVGDDPVWVSDHEYLVRWKGRVCRVDIRKLKPVAVSDQLISESVSLSDLIKKLR